MRSAMRTVRYLRSWLTGRQRIEEREMEVARDEGSLPATVVFPAGTGHPPLPSWVVLHGVTRLGRRHPELRRFVRALAATRSIVVVPEVPEWTRLELAPEAALATVRGALRLLRTVPEADPGRTALVGFSFGAPQAILSAGHSSIRDEIAGVVGFGGYCDLERTVRYQLTGVHEWGGTLHRMRPDPYGRWIVGANFLDRVPGYEDARQVTDALWRLAAEAGDRQIPARDPSLRNRAERLRASLDTDLRPLFDVFVPPGGDEPEPETVDDLVVELAEAGRRVSHLLDPWDLLGHPEATIHILHGRGDRTIPYTETLRLEERLTRCRREDGPDDVRCTVTALFGHSSGEGLPPPRQLLREGLVFARALTGILGAPYAG